MDQVVNQDIDLALADITINLDRMKLVDFSIPTATEGIAIYIKTPDTQAVDNISRNILVSFSRI